MDNKSFEALLRGEGAGTQADVDWALVRLIEYAPYRDIRRLLPLDVFLERWPTLISRVRAPSRRDGMDYFARWVRRKETAHA